MKWERRTEFINGVPFTSLQPVPEQGAPPNFDGGARGDDMPPPPRVEWQRDHVDPAWVTVEIEDGASMFFGTLGE